jgi:hypothetical protein
MSAGIILKKDNPKAASMARKLKLELAVAPDYPLPWDKVLFIAPGVCVPWEMLEYGFHFLERWDAAAPLWRYGVLAQDLGTKEQRAHTQAATLDLRLLTYEPGLLFVRNNAAGQDLVAYWRKACRPGWDERLAFLHALHLVKPRFCALPRSWLADEQQRAQADARTQRSVMISLPQILVKVEISPGRFVKCRPGDEEKTKRHYQHLMNRRMEQQR